MPKGVYAAASAMVTETRLLETTSRNIAFAQVAGYRREGMHRIGFAELLGQDGRTGGGGGIGHTGVMSDGSYHLFSDGTRETTGAQYDLAVQGNGFFTVRDTQNKTLLTRNGNFNIDTQGRLITRDGHLVQGQGGAITIPEGIDRVVIDATGRISTESKTAAGTISTDLDQLRIVTVAQPQQMAGMNGVYFNPGSQPLVDSKATVFQGALERGNVNPIDELVQLVSLQRRYDAAQKALSEQSRAGDGFSDILRS